MIKCRALNERSIFVTARGDILPCCFIFYGGGPVPRPELAEAIKEPNFKTITDSWTTDKPFSDCYKFCDDRQVGNPSNLVHFEKQWKNNSTEKNDK